MISMTNNIIIIGRERLSRLFQRQSHKRDLLGDVVLPSFLTDRTIAEVEHHSIFIRSSISPLRPFHLHCFIQPHLTRLVIPIVKPFHKHSHLPQSFSTPFISHHQHNIVQFPFLPNSRIRARVVLHCPWAFFQVLEERPSVDYSRRVEESALALEFAMGEGSFVVFMRRPVVDTFPMEEVVFVSTLVVLVLMLMGGLYQVRRQML